MSKRADAFYATNITTATTTQVKIGPGVLKRIIINTPVATGTIKVIDNTSGTTSTHGVLTTTTDLKPSFIDYDCKMANGIRIVTTQTQDITIVWE